MNWEKIFSKQTLESGRALYESGQVHDQVELSKNCFVCTITGTEPIRVRILLPERYRLQVSCNCPHVMDGFRCRHMAAAMMKLD